MINDAQKCLVTNILLCSAEGSKATFTLVRFHFKTHNFCYGYACRLHYSAVFNPQKQRLLKTLQTQV